MKRIVNAFRHVVSAPLGFKNPFSEQIKFKRNFGILPKESTMSVGVIWTKF